MNKLSSLIRHLHNPDPRDLGNGIEEWIGTLAAPARISITGRDSSRCRVLVTLLHGNEPSGLKAFFHLLQAGLDPAVDIHCYFIALDAALLQPVFSNRFVPGKRDWNRCFKATAMPDYQDSVCAQLLAEIEAMQPEAVVDMHNTSGEGPSFAVARHYSPTIDAIVSLFTDRLMITDLKLGSIMEHSSAAVPIVTIECGGAFESTSDRIAEEGLTRFFNQDDILTPEQKDRGLEIMHNPIRLVLDKDAGLDYAEQARAGTTLTVRVDIEHFNFGITEADTQLGWIDDTNAGALQAQDPDLNDITDGYYYVRDGGLYTACRQKLFMVTSIPTIALNDCLWYAVKV